MHYFVVGKDVRNEINLNNDFIRRIKNILASTIMPNTEIIFLNPHGNELEDSYFDHETSRKRQLTIINWGHYNNIKTDIPRNTKWLNGEGLCRDCLFEPNPSPTEIIFYAIDGKEIPLASFDTEKNRLYLLWDAIHFRNTSEIEMFKRIIAFFAEKLSEHPLFQPSVSIEQGYNQTIVFNRNLFEPQLDKFKYDYEQKQNSINECRTRMIKLLAESNELSKRIVAFENTQNIPPLTVKNKWVRHIDISSNGFSIFTHPLFITYVDKIALENYVNKQRDYKKYEPHLPDILENLGKKYGWYVGQFQIEINLMNDWQVHFHNLDNKRFAFWHDGNKPSCHPHVAGNGEGCLGNLSELIAQAQSNFEIELLIDVLIGYIQSSNIEDSAGNKLFNWDLVDMTTLKDVLTNEQIVINPIDVNKFCFHIKDDEMPMEED